MKLFIFLTTFLNLAGLGIINPIAPFAVEQAAPGSDSPLLVALLIVSYSLSQFVAVPVLGALSDRYGRRPILILSLIGSALGYVVYGVGGSLFMLFLGRIIDGITGGNIAIINAYGADISRPEERTKMFGLLGAAAGLGFVVGPALGGLLFRLTGSLAAPVYVAAAVTLANALWAFAAMPESLPPDKRTALSLRQMNPFAQITDALRLAHVRLLIAATFVFSAVFAIAQSNFAFMAQDRLGWSLDMIGAGFLVWGVISIIVQAGMIGRLVPRLGETRLAIGGLGIMAAGYGLISMAAALASVPLVWAAIVVTAFGNALAAPTLTALLSKAVTEQEQGRIQGGGQAAQALARVVGPLWGGGMYQAAGGAATYLSGTAALLLTMLIVQASAQAGRRAALAD